MQVSQALIIVLLIANLIATILFGMDKPSDVTNTTVAQTPTQQLPTIINAEVRTDIYDQFAKAFNSADYEALYEMFGDGAKAQFSKEQAFTEFEKLNRFFNSVESGAFTHSEHAGSQGNMSYYILNYAVKLSEKSQFGNSATLKVTVAVEGNEFQIYGIRLNAG